MHPGNADRAPKIGDGTDRADQGEQRNAIRIGGGRGDGIGATARDADDGEAVETISLGDGDNVVSRLRQTMDQAKI